MPSRRELLDALVNDVTQTMLRSADLGPEDRVLARQRVQAAIEQTAVRAHRDVLALTHGDSQGPEANRFSAHMDARYQERGGPDPDVRATRAGDLAADLVAADERSSRFHPILTQRAVDYIAHQVSSAAEAAAKEPGGPSQAPAAAAGAAAGPVAAAPVVAVTTAVKARTSEPPRRGGPSIG
jgi:hypothetical protein